MKKKKLSTSMGILGIALTMLIAFAIATSMLVANIGVADFGSVSAQRNDVARSGSIYFEKNLDENIEYSIGDGSLEINVRANTQGLAQAPLITYNWYISTTSNDIDDSAAFKTAAMMAKKETLTIKSDSTINNIVLLANERQFYVYVQVEAKNQSTTLQKTSRVATVYVLESPVSKPVFEIQPVGAELDIDEKYTLEALATGNGEISYQWFSNTVESTQNAVAIDDATETSLVVDTTENSTIYYFVQATNTLEFEGEVLTRSSYSEIAQIHIGDTEDYTPTINGVAVDEVSGYDHIVVIDRIVDFWVDAVAKDGTKDNLSYQWMMLLSNGTDWGELKGQEQEHMPYQFKTAKVEYFRVKVSFEVDHIVYTATSETIKVDVIDSEDNKTPIIVSQPQSHDNVGIGETVTIEVVAKLPNGDTSTLQYQWYQVVFGSPDGDYMLQDETRASLNVSREVVGDEYYYVVVSNVVGGEVFSTTSEQAKITVVEDEDLDIPNGNGQNGDGLAGESGKFGKSNSSDMLMLITISAGIVLVGFVIVAVVVAKKNKTNRNKYRNIYRG